MALLSPNAADRPWTVADLGEQGLLQRLQAYCPPGVVGDDGALLQPSPGQALVVTTDALVNGVHFSAATTPPHAAGWRAAAANLSDLAAMGALPLGMTVALALPGETALDWVEGFYQGLRDCCQRYGTAIVGGDLCRSPQLVVSITALGEVPPSLAWVRSGAQVGDVILATGLHGASRAGLELLLNPLNSPPNPPSNLPITLPHNPAANPATNPAANPAPALPPPTAAQRSAWIHAHQYPQPRLGWVPLLRQVQQDLALDRPLAAMDSSDGLADAVLQLCRASGVGAELYQEQLPQPPGLGTWRGAAQALEWTLYGGEDFELVLCVPPLVWDRLQHLAPAARFDPAQPDRPQPDRPQPDRDPADRPQPDRPQPDRPPSNPDPDRTAAPQPLSLYPLGRIVAASAGKSTVTLHDRPNLPPTAHLSIDRGFQHF
ncbi:MAG: thiamine-phosphate kinase [Prochlorothrix sp.]